jgi:predicted RNA-binding protein with PUA domain
MSEVLQANVFFMITAVAVVVVTIFIAIALYQLIRIMRAVRDIVERVREGTDVIAEDVANVREGIVTGRFFSAIMSRASEAAGFGKRRAPRKAKKRETSAAETEDDERTVDSDT